MVDFHRLQVDWGAAEIAFLAMGRIDGGALSWRELVGRHLARHLSNAADRGDEAANVISDIVVKIT